MNFQLFETIFENNLLTVEVNNLAKQANGKILIRYKDTVVLSVSVSKKIDTILKYFPLMIIYQEKLYAAGKIPGSFARREGKPFDHEVLNARLIDRSLRPLFSKKLQIEVQIVNTVLSSDSECNDELFALLGSSLSLLISDIPFNTPVSGVCIGKLDNKLVINPNTQQKKKSDFLLTLAGTKKSINMIELISKEVSETEILEAAFFGHKIIQELCCFQEKIQNQINPKKDDFLISHDFSNSFFYNDMEKKYCSSIQKMLNKNCEQKNNKKKLNFEIESLKENIINEYQKFFLTKNNESNFFNLDNKKDFMKSEIEEIFEFLLHREFKKMVLQDKKRIDGRKFDEIRMIKSQVNFLPRTHGSALFTRGETQSLAVVTLGTLDESKKIDDLTDEDKKRFVLHYNFPPFSVGEIGRYIGPTRREIGHGILAEKALYYVLPSEEDFPYFIRVVSEILESNGSSSQATISASSMALMDAGVPLKRSVAGIAIGLFTDGEDHVILSDIQGLEDHLGDMDLKVAGTKKGITALQMDVKNIFLDFDILSEALEKAHIGRLAILKEIDQTISKTRPKLSIYAPKIKIINIKTDKIRDIVGYGGKIISQIIENHDNVRIDIKQDGKIFITHHNEEIIKKTANYILDLIKDVKVGEIYEGVVLKILKDKKGKSFGSIVEIIPKKEGFIHISKLSNNRVEKVEDILSVGDHILVKCIEINEKGKILFSLKNFLE
ncbi:polyribonucleotide nucleotidyltransferase [Candidatus Phytoplasma pini]|uniref:Polyribonucleotide nucleotidyltransferase n=1 Tax=Candidatus Phytoplasma pini TaxID=267362 RepID=A0A559KJU7_9MOLU|nr:polyribonucleotide nucleotidyltransferase [Candidatus Phytoplasma pini]TVY12401.1 Polyribonucleotide nucleotidyltransferase [Candidatus Phytoplasma pini]